MFVRYVASPDVGRAGADGCGLCLLRRTCKRVALALSPITFPPRPPLVGLFPHSARYPVPNPLPGRYGNCRMAHEAGKIPKFWGLTPPTLLLYTFGSAWRPV